jgi:hypothetical protein
MRFFLRWDFVVDATELFLNVFDLLPRGLALLAIQFHRCRAGQPPLSAIHDGPYHLQIA